ncbi:hypothetical protein RB195_018127 [Necator americanus]|uniref:ABC-2 type transporter n=1 Tax=Necator americanus TaxID=51031 RepID=A0ABR1CBC5_NECAM
MGRTWLLFRKNLIVLWRNGLVNLPPIIIPTCAGFVLLVLLHRALQQQSSISRGGSLFSNLTKIFTQDEQSRKTYFHITAGKGLTKLQVEELLFFLSNFMNSSDDHQVIFGYDNNSQLSRNYNDTIVVKDFDYLTKFHYMYSFTDNLRMSWARNQFTEEPANTTSDPTWKHLFRFHLFLANKFLASNRKHGILPNLWQSTHIETNEQDLRRWTNTFTTVAILMVVPAMVSRSYEVCQEKACGLEKLMEVMGAGQFDFYISHAMMSFLCGIFVLFPFEIVNALHLSHAYNFLFMGAACLLLGLSCTLVCLICSAITSSPLTSVITSIVVFLFLFILAVVTNSVESRSVCYYILTLNPFAAYKMFAGSVVNYHIRGAKPWVTFRTAYYDVSSPLEFLLWFLSSSMVMILLLMLKVLYSSTYSTTEGRKAEEKAKKT